MDNTIANRTKLLLLVLFAGEDLKYLEENQRSTPVKGITRLEKLIFLLCIREKILSNATREGSFSFIPFKMGPWTGEVYDELDYLESFGLLSKDERRRHSPEDDAHNDELFSEVILDKYEPSAPTALGESEIFRLTQIGRQKASLYWNTVSSDDRKKIIQVKKQFNSIPLRSLLKYVYENFPEFTTESEIKGKVLGS